MLIEVSVLALLKTATPRQGESIAELPGLRRHAMDAQVRASDLEVKLNQLRTDQVRAGDEASRFNKPVADAQHDLAVARVDLDATLSNIRRLEAAQQASVAFPPPPVEPIIGQSQLEKLGLGVFLLMFPLMLALARRIWTRSGPRMQVARDPESVASLARIEEAMETIAVEVERIGEAQRFTTKVLSERQPDAARVAPPAAPIARREPGTITPH